MAEHDADREPQPIDEDAAWAAIVAGYGEEPADPPGAKPFKSVDDQALLESERNSTGPGAEPEAAAPDKKLGKPPRRSRRTRPRRSPIRTPRTGSPRWAVR